MIKSLRSKTCVKSFKGVFTKDLILRKMKSHLHDTNLHDKTRSETHWGCYFIAFDISEISFRVIKYHVNYFGLKVRITLT